MDTARRADSTQAGDLIPAVWGKRTPDALHMPEPGDYLPHGTAMSQV